MSLFGKLLNNYCDSTVEETDRIIRIGEEKKREAEQRGDFTGQKKLLYEKKMSQLQKNKCAALGTKELYNHFHDDDY